MKGMVINMKRTKRTKKTAMVIALSAMLGVMPMTMVRATAPSVTYRLSSPVVEAGDSFDVTVRFNRVEEVLRYTVMVNDERNDDEALSMMSFHFTETATYEAASFEPAPDDFNDVVAVYAKPVDLNGDCVVYTITVPETAEDGMVISLDFTTQVLGIYNQELVSAQPETINVTVGKGAALLGDIDGDGKVDISDALRLFQHSMMPDLYILSYSGNIDFVENGVIDISDALRLFQYSLMPDLYPIA